jgi:peptidoglycan/xylan/chitin deacetylase (PgdA/CDA1 family)
MRESEGQDLAQASEQDGDQMGERSPGGNTPSASFASEETTPLAAIVLIPSAGRAALGHGHLKRRGRRRLVVASALTTATLCLLVIALLATSASADWSALGFGLPLGPLAGIFGRATGRTTRPSALPAGASPTPFGSQALFNSPQGCVNGGFAPTPVALKLFTASGHRGVGNEIALTFDDGPSPIYTAQILNELHAAGAHATFFVVGRHAQRYPDIVRAEWLAGDAIGNHTWGHDWLSGMSQSRVRNDLTATTEAIRAATGDSCVWLFRPPWGGTNWSRAVGAETQREGLTAVDWDVQAWDWARPGTAVIARRIITQLHPGAIILLHDSGPDTENQNRSQTVAALPSILAAIRARGLKPVTLPQLLADAGLVEHAQPQVRPTPAPIAPHLRLTAFFTAAVPQPLAFPDDRTKPPSSVVSGALPPGAARQPIGSRGPNVYGVGGPAPPLL